MNGSVFSTSDEEYLLFDSACGGMEIVHALCVPIASGVYAFDTIEYQPNSETCALIHRLRKI